MYLPSASSLERASRCIGSAVLPKVENVNEAADQGKALHAFLARVVEVGRDAALAEVAAEYRDLCAAIDLDRLPTCALEVSAEVALAYDPETGTARELGRNIARAYSLVGNTEFLGTADIVAIAPHELYVADWKTGHGFITPARENWQLKFLALAAARVYRRTSVRVGIIRILDDGTPLSDSADFDTVDLDSIAEDLRVLAQKVGRAQELAFLDQPPPLTTGAHCRYCKSLVYCPAQTSLVRRLAGEADVVARDILAELTPERASQAWQRLKVVEEVVGRVREALYAYACEQPIQLPGGTVVGLVQTQRRALDGRVAFRVLRDRFGSDIAEAAVELEASQASIERALRVVSEQSGAKLAGLKRQVMAALDQEGGISLKTSTSIREHRRDKDEPGQQAA
jgi:hypothetical protein